VGRRCDTRKPTTSDLQAIADRAEIEALRGEFTDAAMMRDYDRLASLFTHGGALRMPNIPAEQAGRDQIRAGGERLQGQWEFFVQTTHPGTIVLDGDTATGRAHIQELARASKSSPARADLAEQLGEVAAAFLYSLVQVGLERVQLAGAPVPGRADPARRIFGRADGSLTPRGHQ
jgi:hypothetical protein